jgi:ATP-binding cassette subfamily B protein
MITLSVLFISSIQLYTRKISAPELAGLVSAAALMTSPIMKFIQVYNMYSMGLASIERFYEFMDIPEEQKFGTIPVKKLKGTIEFKNVYFSYTNDHGEKEPVLKNFSIKINQGEHVALVGETGVGKSTILKIILGFYPIEKGQVLVDGININDYKIDELRKAIAYIQQSTVIFMSNIYENISYGNRSASRKEVVNAAKAAFIHESIMEMPKKYHTFTGPDGAQLSGGQRQRVALARAFLKKSSLILLDEATSALDNKTEKSIKKTIDTISKSKTAIIIAHRLSTIRDADRVVVLGKYGKIIEEGTHKQLLNKKGVYSMLTKIK